MRSIVKTVVVFLFLLCTLPVSGHGQEYKLDELHIGHPWARASTGPNGAAYLTVEATGQSSDRLVKVSTPVARMAEIHVHLVENGVMKMRAVDGVGIEPGAPTELKPGGAHIMLMGLQAPLQEGQTFPLTLSFQKAGEVTVQVMVQGVAASEPGHDTQDHHPRQ